MEYYLPRAGRARRNSLAAAVIDSSKSIVELRRTSACYRLRMRSMRTSVAGRLGRRQSRDGPARAADGDELILPVREAGFIISLNRIGSGLDQPRSVFLLRVQQESDAALVDWIVGSESGFSEHPQRLPGRVGIAGHLRKLSPTAVVALGIQDGLARGGDLFLAGAEKMHPPLSGVPQRFLGVLEVLDPSETSGDVSCGLLELVSARKSRKCDFPR